MRRFPRLWVALTAWLALVLGVGGVAAQAAPSATGPATAAEASRPPFPIPPVRPRPPLCPATGIAGSRTDGPAVRLESYFLDDWHLGPVPLPGTGPVAGLVRDYQRTGTLTPQDFLACYWDPTAFGGLGGWRYPPDDGFAANPVPITLRAGQVLDRFGPNNGRFLAPFGARYSQRALPPSNLDTFDQRYANDYHVFRVLKPFVDDGGAAAAWFDQSGGGIQYRLDDKYFPGEMTAPEHASTQWLLDHHYLAPVN